MPESAPYLVAGLGNPGPEYERTRHNVGYRVVDVLASRLGARFRRSRHQAAVAEARSGDHRLILARPTTYMNESGRAVAAAARFYRIPPERIVVVHDDLDIPLADVRVKAGGGTGGHRGLESIVSLLGSRDFARVRIGIGRPPGRQDPADYVLTPFGKRAEQEVGPAIEEATDAVLAIVEDGAAAAQNRFNARAAPE